MKCLICKTGDMTDGTTTVTLQRGETTIVIKDVPATICNQCGEYYLSKAMSDKVLAMTEKVGDKGSEVEVLRWAA